MNTEAGLVDEPDVAGRADLRALLPRRHPRRPRLPRCAASARACRSTTASTRTRRRSRTARTSAATCSTTQNLELEFPIIEKVGIRGVVFTDAGNAWNLENALLRDAGAAPRPSVVTNPCFDVDSLVDLRTSWGFGIRWFSPLGPLRFEWGFPFKPLAVRGDERLRVHDRQLLLVRNCSEYHVPGAVEEVACRVAMDSPKSLR